MANKIKVGLDYFPCEVTIFSDIKVRKLMRYHSGRALPIYLYLLCTIYNNGYYMVWDKDLPFVISESLPGYTEGYISEVINCCLDVDLFSKELWDSYKILSSKGIQERYIKICKLLKRKTEIFQYCLISSEEMANTSEELSISSEEMANTSEEFLQRKRKEKKGKEKESKDIATAANENLKFNPKSFLNDIIIKKYPRLYLEFPNLLNDSWHERLITNYSEEDLTEALTQLNNKMKSGQYHCIGTTVETWTKTIVNSKKRNQFRGGTNDERTKNQPKTANLGFMGI